MIIQILIMRLRGLRHLDRLEAALQGLVLLDVLPESANKRDPDPKDDSLTKKETSTYKGLHSTFAALFSSRCTS